MTDQQHPVAPPLELVQQWRLEAVNQPRPYYDYIATRAARWGADQELEACCEWLVTGPYGFSIEATAPSMIKRLRAAMRPKSPSLAEQALAKTNAILNDPNRALLIEVRETLEINRAALERLQELENNG